MHQGLEVSRTQRRWTLGSVLTDSSRLWNIAAITSITKATPTKKEWSKYDRSAWKVVGENSSGTEILFYVNDIVIIMHR